MHKLETINASIGTSILLVGNKGLFQEEDARSLAVKILGTTPQKLPSHPDFLHVSCEKEKSMGVEVAEMIIRKAAYMPAISEKIVVLISEIDRMPEQAQNKLLKTIEESRHVVVIATAYNNTVLSTIKSRCRVIEYHPLTEQEFSDFCLQHIIPDAATLFYVTNGCPGLIEENADVLLIFKAVSDAITHYNFLNLLSILHLVEENDSGAFYSKYPSHIRNLLAMMYAQVTEILFRELDNNAVARGPVNADKIKKVLSILEDNLAICTTNIYTKNNFFLCIAGIIQTLMEGEKI